jgi:hypothetical protein
MDTSRAEMDTAMGGLDMQLKVLGMDLAQLTKTRWAARPRTTCWNS